MSEEKGDINLGDMSEEELEALIDNGGELPETDDKDDENSNEDNDDNAGDDDNGEDGGAEAGEGEDGGEDNGTSEEKPFYKGKTREELIEMVENGTKKISKQNNEIHDFRGRLESLEQTKKQEIDKSQESVEQELLNRYNEEDITVVAKIVERELSKKDKLKQQAEQKQKETNAQENEAFWSSLIAINPELAKEMESEIHDKMLKDRDNTYFKPGWVQQFYKNYVSGDGKEESKPAANNNLVKRKRSAATAGSGAVGGTKKAPTKSVEAMNDDEYLQHLLSQGIKI